MKEITRAQEDILKVLWQINEGAVSDVLNNIPDPKPAYNTVSTVIKVLERKGYVSHKTFGKTHVYYPLISKKEYTSYFLKGSFKSFFNGSLNQVVSFFANEKKAGINELEELKKFIDQEIEKKEKSHDNN